VIAVTSFDNRSSFAGKWKLGDGMSDLLVSELVESDHFTVVERRELNRVIGELKLQNNEMFRPEGRVKQGNLLNSRYLIRGVINDFSQVAGNSFFVGTRDALFGSSSSRARVAMTLTLIDVESGRIVDSVSVSGEAKAREAFGEGRYKNVAFGGDAYFRTPLGKATRQAIRDGVVGIISSMPINYWRPMIASVQGNQIILNGGQSRGFEVGMEIIVREKGVPVTDPATGELLTVQRGRVIGTIRVDEVNETISLASPVKAGDFQRGQLLSPD
jgi:curli biogenesis system outer membrane secretion channel CsgG